MARKKHEQPALAQTHPATAQTRLDPDAQTDACLSACASLFNHLKHKLLWQAERQGIKLGAHNSKDKPPAPATVSTTSAAAEKEQSAEAKLKQAFLKAEGISGRQYNALWNQLGGAAESVIEHRKYRIEQLKERIKQEEKTLRKIARRIKACKNPQKRKKDKLSLHGKQRKLKHDRDLLAQLEKEAAADQVSICFGTKKLFQKQFHLEENQYPDHAAWRADWRAARNNEFFLIGSGDEKAGNQECQVRVTGPNTFTVRMRVPDKLTAQFGKFIEIQNIHIEYGAEAIIAALDECQVRQRLYGDWKRKGKDKNNRYYLGHGRAINIRFKKDAKGWRIFITTDLARPKIVTSKDNGVISIDLNADHIAVCELDRFGNPVRFWSIDWVTCGLRKHQKEALTSKVVIEIVRAAKYHGKSIAIEDLDFSKKKQALAGEVSKKYARMLSAFAYNSFRSMLIARAFREGVEVWEVDPKYTSLIGRVKYMDQFGVTVHQSAAYVIGRRLLGLSEKPPAGWAPGHPRPVPDGRNGHVACPKPAWKTVQHKRTFWGAVTGRLRAAHQARRREQTGEAWLSRLRQRKRSAACGRSRSPVS